MVTKYIMTETTFLTLVGTGGLLFALFCLGLVFFTIISIEIILKSVGLIPQEECLKEVLDNIDDIG